MDSRIPRSIRVLTERLSRRETLQAYVPPALSMIVLARANNLSTSGVERVLVRGGGNPGNGGGGNPGGGRGNDTPNLPGNGGGNPGNGGGGNPGGGRGNDTPNLPG